MFFLVMQFLLSAAVIVVGGYYLTKFADRIADETELGRVLVGSILLAGATSLPELFVDLNAISIGQPDLAVGDLLGSSLLNLLILSSLDIFFRPAVRAISKNFFHHSLTAVLSIILTALVGIGVAFRLETSIFSVSVFAWSILALYIFGFRVIVSEQEHKPSSEEHKPFWQYDSKRKSVFLLILGYLGAALAIFMASPYLVHAADHMARLSGLGPTFIGTTLVALSTSLPELVATYFAFRLSAPDLAVGNVFGSNIFNMILLVPLDAAYPGDLFASVTNIHLLTALSVIVVTSVAVMALLYRGRVGRRFTAPSSEIVAFMVLLCLYLIYRMRGGLY